MPKKIRVPEYAKTMRHTYQNIVAKLNRGTLEGGKDKGGRFVLVPDDWPESIESDIEPDNDQEQEKPVDKGEKSFNQRSINVEWSNELEGQRSLTEREQVLTGQGQLQIKELTQAITEDKKRSEKTYFKMLAIMLISFVVMAGVVVFIFVWGERSMIRNVESHRATFEAQKFDFLGMIQRRELEFHETVKRMEASQAKEVNLLEAQKLEISETLGKLETEFSETLKSADANHAKELKLLERIHLAEMATLETERSFLLANVLELKKAIERLKAQTSSANMLSGPK